MTNWDYVQLAMPPATMLAIMFYFTLKLNETDDKDEDL